jgi:hypothetical protein
MTSPRAAQKPRPKPGLVATIGVLNIVFGGLLLLCGPCPGLYMLALPSMMPILERQQDMVRQTLEKQKRNEIEALNQQEKTAQTEEEKERIRIERAAKEAEPVPIPPTPDITRIGLNDIRVRLHYGLDVVTCMILNLAMLISGVGLVRWHRWGRGLGIAVAWLKIIRLIALTASMLVVVGPFMNARSKDFLAGMTGQAQSKENKGEGLSPDQEAREEAELQALFKNVNRLTAWGVLTLGCIYPVAALVVLNSRSAKEAFAKPEPQEL